MRLVIVGAGGQARDTAWLVREIARSGERVEALGFVVSDLSRLGLRDSAVLGDIDWLETHRAEFDGLVLGIGTPRARLGVAAELTARFPDKSWPALVHPRAELDRDSAHIARGVMIGAGVAGSVNLVFEEFALVNLGVTLGHEARFGAGSVVNHNASVAGGVRVGRGALIGSGAAVLQYLGVGEGATVGAGAVVTKSIPPNETWVGVPARPLGSAR